jgi:hypothetical protein
MYFLGRGEGVEEIRIEFASFTSVGKETHA